jgi:TetR/AcrR family transcriptional repressor of nem operon
MGIRVVSVPTSMYSQRMDTRERLIESARELLWERGYVGTSPKAIQERAAAGQGSMYHHFSGKPELALAAIRRSAEERQTSADLDLNQPGTAYERVARYLGRERDVLRGCPIGRLTQDPEVITSPELREPVDEMFSWMRTRIAGVLEGELPPELESADIAATIVAVLQGGYVLARAAGDPAPFDRAITGALALLKHALEA